MSNDDFNRPFFGVLFGLLFFSFLVVLSTPMGYVLIQVKPFISDGWISFFKIVTKFGEQYAYVLLVLLFIRTKNDFYFLLILIFLLAVSSYGLKTFFGHPRPYVYFWQHRAIQQFHFIEKYVNKSDNSSFPSGHTFSAFTFYVYFAINYVKTYSLKLVLLSLAILVGISRIYLFQHFYCDVFFGAFLGVFIALFVTEIKQIDYFYR